MDSDKGMSMNDFFDDYHGMFATETGMDSVITGGSEPEPTTLRASVGLKEGDPVVGSVDAGTQVKFAQTLQSMIAYADPPPVDGVGTVVLVKTSSGPRTGTGDGRVFSIWNDGVFRAVQARHLTVSSAGKNRTANAYAMRVADLGSVSGVFKQSAASADELIHKATKDLWSVREGDGGFVIERLFDGEGQPVKV